SGSDLEKTADTSPEQHSPLCWPRDTAENFEKRALASSVATDDSNNLASLHFEVDIPQSPKLLELVTLNDLLAVKQIPRLAHTVARLASDNVAQRRIALAFTGLMTNNVALR